LSSDVRPTLADEHAVLRSETKTRADALLSAMSAGLWPAGELRALVEYFRVEVLQQAEAEEWQLFPTKGSARFTRLSHDHARLRYGVEALERAGSVETSRSPAQLAATVRALLAQLDRHFGMEEQALAQASEPGVGEATPAASFTRSHERYPLTEGPVIDLDALPDEQAVDATVDRLLRLAPGEQGRTAQSSRHTRCLATDEPHRSGRLRVRIPRRRPPFLVSASDETSREVTPAVLSRPSRQTPSHQENER
jgi:hypothetical protein